ncbi:protein bric-a-brac 2 [Trichonephila inaurata madagascariensis]|uniref:Protein bric-a-brac 2 n=1 Tax=Trichonephila inaurata madagascariensis TaxID=2747483 RepID=A0A8X6YM16_9ARAC|nr:protein bric-a-brac 2 [Trichonephila inaurata madagascariensis]
MGDSFSSVAIGQDLSPRIFLFSLVIVSYSSVLQYIKPQILSFDDPPISPVAGTSHGSERSMMMYMDQSGVASIPGPSNYQDNSALVPHDSQPQGEVEKCCEVTFQVAKLYGGINEPVYRNFKQQLCGK